MSVSLLLGPPARWAALSLLLGPMSRLLGPLARWVARALSRLPMSRFSLLREALSRLLGPISLLFGPLSLLLGLLRGPGEAARPLGLRGKLLPAGAACSSPWTYPWLLVRPLCLLMRPFGLVWGAGVDASPLLCTCAGVPDTLMLGDGALDTSDCAASVTMSSPSVTVSTG